jgi:hypothetical protein
VSEEEEGALNLVKSAVVHLGWVESAQAMKGRFGKKAGPNQWVRVDEVGIAREGGETLVRRITESRRTEWAELPVADTSGREKLQKRIRRLIKGADTERARKGSRMEKNANRALIQPSEERWRRGDNCDDYLVYIMSIVRNCAMEIKPRNALKMQPFPMRPMRKTLRRSILAGN